MNAQIAEAMEMMSALRDALGVAQSDAHRWWARIDPHWEMAVNGKSETWDVVPSSESTVTIPPYSVAVWLDEQLVAMVDPFGEKLPEGIVDGASFVAALDARIDAVAAERGEL